MKEQHTTEHRDTTSVVFSRIEKEGICPRPRWHFFLREWVIWTAGGISVGIGALAVTATLFELRNTWWSAYEATHETFLTFLMDGLPVVWILSLAAFTVLACTSVRFTKRGYVHSLPVVLLGIVILSGAGGVALYAFGAGEFADEQVGVWVPFQRPLLDRERSRWMMPEEGRIAGIVRELPFSERVAWVEAVDGTPYEIDIADFPLLDRTALRVGDQIRILGVPTTTPGVLHGCVIFIKSDDMLRRIHPHAPLGMQDTLNVESIGGRERSTLFARNSECKGVKPYARLVLKAQ